MYIVALCSGMKFGGAFFVRKELAFAKLSTLREYAVELSRSCEVGDINSIWNDLKFFTTFKMEDIDSYSDCMHCCGEWLCLDLILLYCWVNNLLVVHKITRLGVAWGTESCHTS